jgi:Lhr-like helicase
MARMHRMGIGTITSNTPVRIVYTNRKEIGTVEEPFVSRLKKGDVFFFAGRQLEFFQMKDMVLYVKGTRRKSTVTPTWGGGQLAISDTLSHHLRQEVELAKTQTETPPSPTSSPPAPRAPLPSPPNAELQTISPILGAQAASPPCPPLTNSW